MVRKKGLTLPCYVCYTFIHLGFHVFLNAHSELQSEMCRKENMPVDKPFALPYSSADRNIQVVTEIGVDFRTRTPDTARGRLNHNQPLLCLHIFLSGMPVSSDSQSTFLEMICIIIDISLPIAGQGEITNKHSAVFIRFQCQCQILHILMLLKFVCDPISVNY